MIKPPQDILDEASGQLRARELVYGSVEENFTRAASIASHWLMKPVTARDVAVIMASIKISRIAKTPDHADSWVDLCNYIAFGAAFSQSDDEFHNTFADAVELQLSAKNGHGA